MHIARQQSFAQLPAVFPELQVLDDEFDTLGIEDDFYDDQFGKTTAYYSRRVY